MKLVSTFPPGRVPLRSRYEPNLVEALKNLPGCSWDAKNRFWWVPIELANSVLAYGAKYKAAPIITWPQAGKENPKPRKLSHPFNSQLHEFQRVGVSKALAAGRFFFSWETGLGKTIGAIACMDQLHSRKTLIVCPAIVRRQWKQRLLEWLEFDDADVFVFEPAAKKDKDVPPNLDAQCFVTSYELLPGIIELFPINYFDVIVFDEAHYLQTPKSARSVAAKTVLQKNSGAFQLGLTATPLANDPVNVWHPLDLFWPGRFGFQQQFKKRYCEAFENAYAYSGFNYKGLNKQHSAELRSRLETVSHRAVRAEVAHLLPAFDVTGLHLRPKDPSIVKASQRAMMARKKNGYADATKLAFVEKQEVTLERIRDKARSNSKILVFTHLRSSASSLFAAATKEFDQHAVFHIDGDVSHAKRDQTIAWAMQEEQSILIATMHSIGIGRDDLTGFTAVIGCEYDYNPIGLIQMLGRFSRLSGKVPSAVELIIFKGTHDEVVCENVLQKLEHASELLKASTPEQGIQKALQEDLSEEDWLDRLADVAAGGDDE